MQPSASRHAKPVAVPALLTILLAVATAACGASPSPSPTRPAGSAPTTSATPSGPTASGTAPAASAEQPVVFATGEASLELNGGLTDSAELGEIVPNEGGAIFSGFDPIDGTSVSWRESQQGWYVTVSGFHGEGAIKTNDPTPFLSITAPDGRNVQDMDGKCTVNATTSSRERFEGTIDCAGLQWQDDEGEPTGDPFGAKVTFSAAP